MDTAILWFLAGIIAYGYGVASLWELHKHDVWTIRITSAFCSLFGPIFLAVLLLNNGTDHGWKL